MLRSTGLAALLATSLGVTAMVIAMALMTGYTEDLERKLIGLQGEVIASPLGRRGLDHDDVQRRLRAAAAVPGVVRAGRVAYGEGALASAAVPEGLGVVLRGVAPDDPIVARHGGEIGSDEEGIPGALLGAELARRLEVASGDLLRLVILDLGERRPRFRYRSIRVTGTFASGFAEFDARWILIDREVLLAAGGSGFEMVEFKIADPRATEDVARALEEALGTDWVVERWQRLNRDLFAALELQKLGLFAVLALIVLVSTFNVASGVVVLVRERLRDLGVLAALGLRPRAARRVFLAYGALVAGVGSAVGVAVGAGVSWLFTELELIRFDAEMAAIYFLSSVPFRVRWTDVALIVAFTLGIGLVSCWLPAWRGARIDPARALRYE